MRAGLTQFALTCAALAALVGCQSANGPRPNATPEMDRTVKQTPEEETTARAKAATDLAAGWFQRGQYNVALEELAQAIKVKPDYHVAYGIYGLVYHAIKDDTQAEANFQKALALKPDDPEVRTNYGWFLCRTAREAASVAEFEKAADNTLYRTPELALLYAAQCSAKIGKMAQAEGFYKRVLVVVPDYAPAYFGLAEVTYRLARYPDARSYLRMSLRSPAVPAHILHIGWCVERRLGDSNAAESYITQLTNRFPKSVEIARIQNGDCD